MTVREMTNRQLRGLLFRLPYEALWAARREEAVHEYVRRVRGRRP